MARVVVSLDDNIWWPVEIDVCAAHLFLRTSTVKVHDEQRWRELIAIYVHECNQSRKARGHGPLSPAEVAEITEPHGRFDA